MLAKRASSIAPSSASAFVRWLARRAYRGTRDDDIARVLANGREDDEAIAAEGDGVGGFGESAGLNAEEVAPDWNRESKCPSAIENRAATAGFDTNNAEGEGSQVVNADNSTLQRGISETRLPREARLREATEHARSGCRAFPRDWDWPCTTSRACASEQQELQCAFHHASVGHTEAYSHLTR